MNYSVIDIDLVHSRQLMNRRDAQVEFQKALNLINKKYIKYLEVPFDFTLGDEVQGVMTSLVDSYHLILDFRRYFTGPSFYAAVGYGSIATDFSQRSGKMDGIAFHLARQSMERLKEEFMKSHAARSKERFAPLVCYSFASEETTKIVNSYLRLVELLKFTLTDKQAEVYDLLFQVETYKEIAKILNQSKSAITQKIKAGHIEEIRSGEKGLLELLYWVERNDKKEEMR